MGDTLLCAIIDTATRDGDGDFYKLPNYYEKAEDSPIAGYIVVFVIYIFFVIVNLMIFYNYIIYLHLNGRLQDIYVRLLGDPRVFFIPNDNELSLRHLLWCYYTAIVNSQRIVVNHIQILNDYGEPCTVSTLQTSTYLSDVSLEVSRTFIKDEVGCIKELTEKEISYLNVKEKLTITSLLSKVPTNKSREFYDKIGSAANKNLALLDIEAANPYANKFNNDDYSQITSRRTEKSLRRKISMPKRMGTAKSSKFRRSNTNRGRNSGRRSSIRSKKSLVTPSSKKPRNANFRRKTQKNPDDSSVKAKLNRNETAQNADQSDLINNSILSPQRFKSTKYL